MTPKEKAFELYIKFREYVSHPIEDNEYADYMAKQCVLICVNEITSACEYNHVESWNTDWWNKVKQELAHI